MTPDGSSFYRRFASDKLALAGLAGFALLMIVAILAPLISPQNPYDLAQLSIVDGRLPPGARGEFGNLYLLGTDEQGRDILSAIIYGLRISLFVGITSVALAASLGSLLGMISAYIGGKVDALIMRLVDLQLSLPAILIALLLLAILGKGIDKIIVVLVLSQWAIFARIARAGALVEMKKDYIHAARAFRLGGLRIIVRHIAPNCLAPIIVMAVISIAGAISLEATLSFLGLGVPVTRPSLGLLISNGFDYLLSGRYWISTFPGVALVIVIVAINIVGDRLSKMLDPRLNDEP